MSETSFRCSFNEDEDDVQPNNGSLHTLKSSGNFHSPSIPKVNLLLDLPFGGRDVPFTDRMTPYSDFIPF